MVSLPALLLASTHGLGGKGLVPLCTEQGHCHRGGHAAWDGGSILVAPVLMLEVWETLGAS